VADDEVQKGDLRRVPLFRVLGALCRRGVTGAVEIDDTVGLSRAFLLNGILQGARSARLKNPLGRILVLMGAITEAQLEQALEEHNRTDQLIGQVLRQQGLVSDEVLQQAVAAQSRQNLLSLFGLSEGRFQLHEGLVHLADFTPAPLDAALALYEGTREHATEAVTAPLLARLAFSAVKLAEAGRELLAPLGPAEQMALKLLHEPRLLGDLARRVPLPPRSLAAILATLDGLGLLESLPALKAK
jgi:hypothetical protein